MSDGTTWPNVYRMVGSADALLGLSEIENLRTDDHGVLQLDDGSFAVTAYATQDAADQASALGIAVTLVITGADLQQEIADENGGIIVA